MRAILRYCSDVSKQMILLAVGLEKVLLDFYPEFTEGEKAENLH